VKFEELKFIDKISELQFAYSKELVGNSIGKYIFDLNGQSICKELISKSDQYSFQGFFSGVSFFEGSLYIYRDPNGFSKLYVGEEKKGKWIISRSWLKIAKKGIKLNDIYALPSGIIYKHEDKKLKIINKIFTSRGLYKKDEVQYEFNRRLNQFFSSFFKWLEKNYPSPNTETCVALSGGLDSSTLLVIGSKYSSINAHTLELPKSLDSKIALKIAKECKCNITTHSVTKKDIYESLKISPLYCEDWRDFNVHCSALNLLLAKRIKETCKGNTFVITGDLMNEYLCDYQEEIYKGQTYYKLPKINKKSLQNWLVKGLKTSSREDRVFESQGLITVQPYASFYDIYSNLSREELEMESIKRICNLTSETQWLDKFISNTKLRAQIGTKESMGILAIAVDNKFNDDSFAETIAKYCNEKVDVVKSLIFGGTFRVLQV
tara:strand:+ start:13184 stop:14488 length:1305 start_codon:yes stop_codon:yes gene_type:complete